MTRILQLALILAALAAAFACTEVGLKARSETLTEINGNAINQEVAEAHKTNLLLNDPHNGIPAILADAHRTELIAAGAITNIEKGTRTWQKKQNAIADQTLQDERSLNTALLSLSMTANSISGLTEEQKSSLSNLENTASASFMQMGALSDTVEKQLTPVLASFAQASANAADTTASMDASAHDVQAVADKFKSDFTKPKNRVWAYFKALVGMGSSAGNIATLAK